MENLLERYSLPDAELLESTSPGCRYLFWRPQRQMVVLGRGSALEEAVYPDLIRDDRISLVQRPTGGESVFLTPAMAVLSLVMAGQTLPRSKEFFRQINAVWIAGLQDAGVGGVTGRGISDLAIGDMKIYGSALYRKPGYLFYHGVLNLAESPKKIGRYLRHPQREPEYRRGRDHERFVTSLTAAGFFLDVHILEMKIRKHLDRNPFFCCDAKK